MKKLLLITILIGILYPGLLNAFQLKADTLDGYIVVRSDYDRPCPGEIIKISLHSSLTISKARALFKGKYFTFVPHEGGTSFFTLIGLGLDTEPGSYDLVIEVDLPGERQKIFTTKLALEKGSFRHRKINVDKKFTSPSQEAEKRIQKEQELVTRIYGESAPRWLGEGNFNLPVEGTLINNFGDKRVFNNDFKSRHRGIDIRSPAGRIVRSVNSGRIVMARDLYFAGRTVIIDHGIGLFSIYCHLSKMVGKEGTTVKKGAVIGRVGSTGRVTGPHLHWGIKLSGDNVNPLSLLRLSFD